MGTASKHVKFMQRALELAAKGLGHTTPNPMVGAVIVRNGKVVSEGHHPYIGGPHAEVVALRRLKNKSKPFDLYVTLEPCTFTGHTPPCTEALLNSAVRKIYVATKDPNKRVNGKGITKLRKNNIRVHTDLLADQARQLNAPYFKFHRSGKPWITLKAATSLDGYIAAARGSEKWLTSKEARHDTHFLRAQHHAILVGRGTLHADNPLLNVRRPDYSDHNLKVILDSRLAIKETARVLNQPQRLILVCGDQAPKSKARRLERRGAAVVTVPCDQHVVHLPSMLNALGAMGISSILVEGGQQVFTNFIKQDLVDRFALYLAPKILGSGRGKSENVRFINDLNIDTLDQAFTLGALSAISRGPDLRIDVYRNRRKN